MEFDIFGTDWMYNIYFLGMVDCSADEKIEVKLMFYSHSQRFLVKIMSIGDRLATSIEETDTFVLKPEDSFHMNYEYYKPYNFKRMLYKDLSEDVLYRLKTDEYNVMPLPTHKGNETDEIIFDERTESIFIFASLNARRYLWKSLCRFSKFNKLYHEEAEDIMQYPERMVKQLDGQPNDEMFKVAGTLTGNSVKLLGVFFTPTYRGQYHFSTALYFDVDNKLYKLSQGGSTIALGSFEKAKLEEITDMENLCDITGTNKTEFYICGKEVDIKEYNLINCSADTKDTLWNIGKAGVDLIIESKEPKLSTDFIVSSLFVYDIKFGYEAKVLTSEMEEIKGSSYAVKRKRFLAEVEKLIK